ncbi:hypothetical protein [Paractinoplanes hotanensis]|uniref:Uncharacterized protein n=1 Tax=Paractinoplanes hotanensis TaxID=2906497 RepID=A0ABT0XYY3_9ACTN|nr:hypothetical protein [Actinoplanes hotanensis]MCM4078999.1 hypothetical protein [Actinoplanes hotanensis]
MSEDRLLSPVRRPHIPAQRGPLIDLSVTPRPVARPPVTRGRLAIVAAAVFLAGAAGYTALRPVLPSFAPSSGPATPAPPSATEQASVRPDVPAAAADPIRHRGDR